LEEEDVVVLNLLLTEKIPLHDVGIDNKHVQFPLADGDVLVPGQEVESIYQAGCADERVWVLVELFVQKKEEAD
jgi:hypothetical protein